MIYLALIYMFISFTLSIWLTPLARKIAAQKEILDHPSDVKIHNQPVARTGGAAIVVAFAVTLCLFLGFRFNTKIWLLILAAVVIVVVGLIDDVRGLTPIQKLAGQSIAALILAASAPFVGGLSPALGGVFVFLFVLLVCNAVNLIDGLDGLAGGLSIIAAIGFMAIGILMDKPIVVGLSAIVAGAALGFLPYNWSPASIFMGDTGSLFLGFMLAAIGVMSIQKVEYSSAILIPFLILGVPIFDTVVTILRRVLNKKELLEGDLAHSYNLVQRRGLTTRTVVIIYYLFGVLLCACGVLIEYMQGSFIPILIVLLVVGLLAFLTVKFKLLCE